MAPSRWADRTTADILHLIAGSVTVLHRDRVKEGLDGASHLLPLLGNRIPFEIPEVGSPDIGLYISGMRILGQEGGTYEILVIANGIVGRHDGIDLPLHEKTFMGTFVLKASIMESSGTPLALIIIYLSLSLTDLINRSSTCFLVMSLEYGGFLKLFARLRKPG